MISMGSSLLEQWVASRHLNTFEKISSLSDLSKTGIELGLKKPQARTLIIPVRLVTKLRVTGASMKLSLLCGKREGFLWSSQV